MQQDERLAPVNIFAIKSALDQLITLREQPDGLYVHLPIFYPSGAAATVVVTTERSGFRITDAGFGYREAELVGGERGFSRRAKSIAENLGLDVSPKIISAYANENQLAATIADVGSASAQVAHEIVATLSGRNQDLLEHLRQRLVKLFDPAKLEFQSSVPGASTRTWEVAALVRLDRRQVVFDAVENKAISVYSTATKFRDIALLDNAPTTIAVVHSVKDMGSLYNILAQSGHVLQEDAPDGAFRLATAA